MGRDTDQILMQILPVKTCHLNVPGTPHIALFPRIQRCMPNTYAKQWSLTVVQPKPCTSTICATGRLLQYEGCQKGNHDSLIAMMHRYCGRPKLRAVFWGQAIARPYRFTVDTVPCLEQKLGQFGSSETKIIGCFIPLA